MFPRREQQAQNWASPVRSASTESRAEIVMVSAICRFRTTPMNMTEWLQTLGLERYEQAFRENRIEADVLPSLTAEDLKDLGVTLVGDRRRLLDAIAALDNKHIQEPQAEPSEGIDRSLAPTGGTAGTEAERRQLTVMFCDLVGSTPLSTRFDPEDLREIVGAYHRCVTDTVARFGGFVAKYMGDGVLIYFG